MAVSRTNDKSKINVRQIKVNFPIEQWSENAIVWEQNKQSITLLYFFFSGNIKRMVSFELMTWRRNNGEERNWFKRAIHVRDVYQHIPTDGVSTNLLRGIYSVWYIPICTYTDVNEIKTEYNISRWTRKLITSLHLTTGRGQG